MLTIKHMKALFLAEQNNADASNIANKLKAAGVNGYSYHVTTGDITLYDQKDEQLRLPGYIRTPQVISPRPDPDRLVWALKIYQAGKSGFTAFCKTAASAGVNLWIMDLKRMTTSYFTASGRAIHEENILPQPGKTSACVPSPYTPYRQIPTSAILFTTQCIYQRETYKHPCDYCPYDTQCRPVFPSMGHHIAWLKCQKK